MGGLKIAGIEALDGPNARIALKAFMKLTMADIDGMDPCRAALKQDLGEAAGGGAEIEAGQAHRIEAETLEAGGQFEGGARNITGRRIVKGDVGLRRHQRAGFLDTNP